MAQGRKSYQPWQLEWAKFTPSSVEEMKKWSDNTHLEKEWMCYIYEQDYGIMTEGDSLPILYRGDDEKLLSFKTAQEATDYAKKHGINGVSSPLYHLGVVSFGGKSKIEVNPKAKETQDQSQRGLKRENRKWTIHGHPLKDGKIYTGRQYFSSTDILDEFVKTRDSNEPVVQFVVFPHQQQNTNTGDGVIHNRVRILMFPDTQTIVEAMKESSPNTDPYAINRETGFNENASDGSLKNKAGADWFAFQESLGKRGYMGIVDIEGKAQGAEESGTKVLGAEEISLSNGSIAAILVGVTLLIAGVIASKSNFGSDVESSLAGVEVVDDFDSEGESHWWHL
jgi:hypothetical protein